MLINYNFILFIIVLLLVCSFIIGYLIGLLSSTNGVSINNKNIGLIKSSKNEKTNHITIDDTKYVVDINTDGLEKKYDSIGEVKQSSDNLSQSVNKLKQLKR